jgi:hypothetical protein
MNLGSEYEKNGMVEALGMIAGDITLFLLN